MKINHAELGQKYYQNVGEKNIEAMEKFLHEEVELHSPLAVAKGKEAVVKATSNFMKSFNTLTIRSVFGSEEQAMVVYITDIPGISNNFPGASLITIQDGLIKKIELFYDGSRFKEKKEEIFS